MKRIITHEYKTRADEVKRRTEVVKAFFIRKLSDDTDSGTTLQSVPLQGHQ